MGTGRLDDDRGRRNGEAGEDLQEAGAALVFLIRVGPALIQGEAQVDDRNVDGRGLDDFRGLFAGLGTDGRDTQGLKKAWETVNPGIRLPPCVGQEQVEPPVGRGGGWGLDAHFSHA